MGKKQVCTGGAGSMHGGYEQEGRKQEKEREIGS